MQSQMTRRNFVTTVGAAAGVTAATGAVAAATPDGSTNTRVVGVACSPRKGKTTATAVSMALDAAKEIDSRVETELIDLGGMDIRGWTGGAKPGESQPAPDDFEALLPTLRKPNLGGLIIGSPVYFRTMSSLCKAFLERLAVLRKPALLLADKPVGVLSVGAYRNGGQELVIEQIQTAMLCHEVMVVGGKPRAHQGATLWNAYDDDITKDEFGIDTARKLGIRVAEAALHMTALQSSHS